MTTGRLALISLMLAACGGTGGSTQVSVVVPAGAQPSGNSTAPASPPMSLGTMPQGMPAAMTTAPANPPAAPTSTTVINNISVNITSVITFAYDSTDKCSAIDLTEGMAYCDDAQPRIVTFCDHGDVYYFDCNTYAADANCGYTFEGNGRVACVDTPKTKIDPAIVADKQFAFKTDIPCTKFDESYAECMGNYAYYCSGGDVYAQDCSLYVSTDGSSKPATCGASADGALVECHW
jgi:hypothetical protein